MKIDEVRRLTPDQEETLDHGEPRQDQEDPQGGGREPEGQADAEHDHPLGPLHEAALAVEPQALRPGPLVGHEQ